MGMETSSPSCRNNKQTPGEFSIMSAIYLPRNASGARLRDAENARRNRLEIVKAYSQGQISRREIFKWGLVTAGGLIAPIGGLSPFVQECACRRRQWNPDRCAPKPFVWRNTLLPAHAAARPVAAGEGQLHCGGDPRYGGFGRPVGLEWARRRTTRLSG